MIRKIDAVLDRVVEKESNLPVSHLGLVERVRYDEKQNKLYVFTKAVHSTHGCCSLLALVQQSDTLKSSGGAVQKPETIRLGLESKGCRKMS